MARGQGTLEVKFKPVGHKSLVLALKAMNKEMSKIEKRFGGVDSETKKTNKSAKSFFNTLGLGIRNTRNTNKSISSMGMAFSVLRSKLLLAGFAMTLFSKTVGAAARKYIEQEKALMKLNTALASTGRSSKMSTGELAQFAAQLQKITTFGDEEIISAQALLATFTSIGEDVFPEATKAILDLASAMGQDLQQTTIQVGKALNDPIQGMTALRRVGIQLNETQQESIKNFVKQGDVMSAQEVIMRELSVQFGGMAQAMGLTRGGELQQIANQWGDIAELIGKIILAWSKESGLLDFVARNTEKIAGSFESIAGEDVGASLGQVNQELALLGKVEGHLFGIRERAKGDGLLHPWQDPSKTKLIELELKFLKQRFNITEDQVPLMKGYLTHKSNELFMEQEILKARKEIDLAYENIARKRGGALGTEDAEYMAEVDADRVIELEKLIEGYEISVEEYKKLRIEAAKLLGIHRETVEPLTQQQLLEMAIGDSIAKKLNNMKATKTAMANLTDEQRKQAVLAGMIADKDLTSKEYITKLKHTLEGEKQFVEMLRQAKKEAEGQAEVQAEIQKIIDATLGLQEKSAKITKETPDHLKSQIEWIAKILDGVNNTIAAEKNQLAAIDLIIQAGGLEEEQLKRILELRKQITGETEKESMTLTEQGNLVNQMALNEIDQWVSMNEAKLNSDIANERARNDFQEMSAHAQEARIEELRKAHADKYSALYAAQKVAAFGEVGFQTAINFAKYSGRPLLQAAVVLSGISAAARIHAQPTPSYEQGGVVGGRRHRYGGTPIEAEQGEFVMSRNAVSRIGLANLNRMNAGSGGGAVTVNVSGNVLTQDFVENELAEGIRRAIGRGKDFGIS